MAISETQRWSFVHGGPFGGQSTTQLRINIFNLIIFTKGTFFEQVQWFSLHRHVTSQANLQAVAGTLQMQQKHLLEMLAELVSVGT